MSLYRLVACSKLGTAMATWFSFPRDQTLVGGEADEKDREFCKLVLKVARNKEANIV